MQTTCEEDDLAMNISERDISPEQRLQAAASSIGQYFTTPKSKLMLDNNKVLSPINNNNQTLLT